jgi:hypothetical protein
MSSPPERTNTARRDEKRMFHETSQWWIDPEAYTKACAKPLMFGLLERTAAV